MKAILVIDVDNDLDLSQIHANVELYSNDLENTFHKGYLLKQVRPLPKADIKKILEITKHKSQAYKFGFIDGFDYYKKILKEFGGENVLGETE